MHLSLVPPPRPGCGSVRFKILAPHGEEVLCRLHMLSGYYKDIIVANTYCISQRYYMTPLAEYATVLVLQKFSLFYQFVLVLCTWGFEFRTEWHFTIPYEENQAG